MDSRPKAQIFEKHVREEGQLGNEGPKRPSGEGRRVRKTLLGIFRRQKLGPLSAGSPKEEMPLRFWRDFRGGVSGVTMYTYDYQGRSQKYCSSALPLSGVFH